MKINVQSIDLLFAASNIFLIIGRPSKDCFQGFCDTRNLLCDFLFSLLQTSPLTVTPESLFSISDDGQLILKIGWKKIVNQYFKFQMIDS